MARGSASGISLDDPPVSVRCDAVRVDGVPAGFREQVSPGCAEHVVVFYADASRARLVLAVAERHDIGLTTMRDGGLHLCAGNVDEMLSAAIELMSGKDECDALPPPPTAGLLGPDGHWAADLEDVLEALGIE
jgi:hypothetical protein